MATLTNAKTAAPSKPHCFLVWGGRLAGLNSQARGLRPCRSFDGDTPGENPMLRKRIGLCRSMIVRALCCAQGLILLETSPHRLRETSPHRSEAVQGPCEQGMRRGRDRCRSSGRELPLLTRQSIESTDAPTTSGSRADGPRHTA